MPATSLTSTGLSQEMHPLKPIHESVKSYYGKANVVKDGDVEVLYSYTTPVAKIKDGVYWMHLLGQHSVTTNRHIREFFKQHGLVAEKKDSGVRHYFPGASLADL